MKSKRQRSVPQEAYHAAPPVQSTKSRFWWIAVGLFVVGAGVAAFMFLRPPGEVPVWGYEVVKVYPHDPGAFTQGLLVDEGVLYESTGKEGRSSVRIVDLETGKPSKLQPLDARFFGEGIAVWKDKLIQVTWQDNWILIYDKKTLRLLERVRRDGVAWGLTCDGKHLILSDGTSLLRFLDPETLQVQKTLDVRRDGRRVKDLNELEYVDGFIYANVWHEDFIYQISPRTGRVTAMIDLSGLLADHERLDSEAVLNGIAYDHQEKRWFVTGKFWPKLFEVKWVPKR